MVWAGGCGEGGFGSIGGGGGIVGLVLELRDGLGGLGFCTWEWGGMV